MLLAFIIFAVIFVIVMVCIGLGLAYFETSQRKQLRAMLENVKPAATLNREAELVRKAESEDPFARWMQRFPPAVKIEALLLQSSLSWTIARLVVLSCIGLVVGAVLGWNLGFFSAPLISAAMFGAIGLFLPLLFVLRKRAKALGAFEKQFPDALDFLSRSMRAGHGFTISLEALGQDAAEPLATTLRRVSNEMQLGSTLAVALNKMVIAVPLVDVRFFVSTVILQQESGGNLSEILNKLAHVIRERCQLKGQVKALSAHGRITGLVLLLMPVIVTLILLATSPNYLKALTDDKDGRKLLYGAVAGQIVGYFVIKKIVNIRV